MSISLEEFCKGERERLEKFRLAWLKGHAANPEQFPLSFDRRNGGMWHECLDVFDGRDFAVESPEESRDPTRPKM